MELAETVSMQEIMGHPTYNPRTREAKFRVSAHGRRGQFVDECYVHGKSESDAVKRAGQRYGFTGKSTRHHISAKLINMRAFMRECAPYICEISE